MSNLHPMTGKYPNTVACSMFQLPFRYPVGCHDFDLFFLFPNNNPLKGPYIMSNLEFALLPALANSGDCLRTRSVLPDLSLHPKASRSQKLLSGTVQCFRPLEQAVNEK